MCVNLNRCFCKDTKLMRRQSLKTENKVLTTPGFFSVPVWAALFHFCVLNPQHKRKQLSYGAGRTTNHMWWIWWRMWWMFTANALCCTNLLSSLLHLFCQWHDNSLCFSLLYLMGLQVQGTHVFCLYILQRGALCGESTIIYSYHSYFKTSKSLISKLYIYWDMTFVDMPCRQRHQNGERLHLQERLKTYWRCCFYLWLSEGVMGIENISNGRCLVDNLNIKPLFAYHFRVSSS